MLAKALVGALVVAVVAGCGGSSPGVDAVATVDGREIPSDRLTDAVDELSDYVVANAQPDEYDTYHERLRLDLLNFLITAEVVRSVAEAQGVEVGDAEIDAAERRLLDVVGGEDGLELALGSMWLTRALYDEILVPQEAYLAGLRAHVLGNEEIEMRTARHIVVETLDEAERIRRELEGGAEFADVASEYSLDAASTGAGGDLGTYPRGEYAPELDEAVWSASPGEVVGPVESTFGFHLVEVTAEIRAIPAELSADDVSRLARADIDALIGEAFTTTNIVVTDGVGVWDSGLREVLPAETG